MEFQPLESRIALSVAPLVASQTSSLPVNPREIVAAGDVAYFVAEDDTHGEELWVTDGTPKGTRLVKDITEGMTDVYDYDTDEWVEQPAGSGITSMTVLGGKAVFFTNAGPGNGDLTESELWTSDGTDEGTIQIAADLGSADSLTLFKGSVFFFAPDDEQGMGLWKWNGGDDDIALVNSGLVSPDSLTVFGERLFFIDQVTGPGDATAYGLYATKGDGTAPELIRQLPYSAPQYETGPSMPSRIIGATNAAIFLQHDDGVTGAELWKSDGTSAGTNLVKDIDPGSSSETYPFEIEFGDTVSETYTYANSSYPDFLTAIGPGVAVFNAFTMKGGSELWRTDGTANGTFLVKDLAPGVTRYTSSFGEVETYPNSSEPSGFTSFKGATYFTTTGGSLWKTDGTAKGTTVVKRLSVNRDELYGESDVTVDPAIVGGRLLYRGFNKALQDWELWVSDGSAAGSMRLQDLPPAVTSVKAPDAGTYAAGQDLTFVVNFTDAVTVAGKAQIGLRLGKAVKQAGYISGSGTSALTFRYVASAGDFDGDGVELASLTGNIRSAASNKVKALLSLPTLDTSGVRVDAVAPAVKSVAVAAPGSKTYSAGETIAFLVTFTEAVKVTGIPQIAVTFGKTVRQAVYVSGANTDVLRFELVVQQGDAAPKGIKLGTSIVLSPSTVSIADAWNNLPKALKFKAPSTAGVKV